MEDLNNSQIVLLAILVSFITSITTGVLTVSLVNNDEPQTVTQTINRVVERTIEKVVPGETKTVVKEVPVVVTEEELIVKVVNNASPNVGTLTYEADNSGKVLGLGWILDGANYVVTSGDLLPGGDDKNSGPYDLTLEDSTKVVTQLAGLSADKKIAILKVTRVDAPTGAKNVITNLLNGGLKGVKLSTADLSVGQTVIGLGTAATDGSPVAVGIVSSLTREDNSTSTLMIKTNASNKDNLGGPLFLVQGEAAALNIAPGQAVPARLIKAVIDSIK